MLTVQNKKSVTSNTGGESRIFQCAYLRVAFHLISLARVMDSSADTETLFVVRCIGLNVAAKTNFKNVGVLSNIFLRATGKNASNEKKTIKLAQSAPFRPNINGRPPNAEFTQIYVSEIMEDTADAIPSLVASMRCPEELDCMIRLSVYYSSNLTAEKEVLLAGTSFTRKELVRAVHNKGMLISDMVSEHCPGSKAYIEIMTHMPNVLPDVATILPSADPTALQLAASTALGFNITAPRSPMNPFKQRYVFYAENNQFEPLVHAEESTWEPRFSALLPAMFMENFTSALVRSINAWNMRYELERKRQGRFRSLKEAIQHGWHSVNVTVHAARIGGSRLQTERVRQQQLMQEQALLVAALTEQSNGNAAGGGGAVNNRNSARYANRQVSVASSGGGGAGSNVGGATGPILPTYNVCIPVPEDPDEVTEMDVQVAEVVPGLGRGARGRVLHDETAPCTFVEVSIQDQSQMFLLPLGRTNTEYYNLNPVYGSNLNAAAAGRKAVTAASAAADCVEICIAEKEHAFYSFDTTDRDAIARHFAQHWHHRRQVLEAQQSQQSSAARSTVNGGAPPDVSGSGGSHSGSLSSSGSVSQSGSMNNSAHDVSGAVRAVSSDYNPNPLRQVNAAVLQSVLPSPLSQSIPIPPLPCADTVHKVVGKEAHFYRFVSTCHQSSVLFEVCLEDPNSAQRKRVGTCTLPISAGCRKELWLPVRFSHAAGDVPEGEYENVELHVSVSVKSPFDEDQDPHWEPPQTAGTSSKECVKDRDIRDRDRDRDYFSTKPSPAAMPEVLVYQRTVQGPPQRQDEGWELQQRRSRASSAVESGGLAHSVQPSSTAAAVAALSSASKDDLDAVHPHAGAEHKINELGDYRGTIADAYEWMWYVGFNGIDPLLLDEDVARGSRRRPTSMKSVAPTNTANSAGANSRPVSNSHIASSSHNTPPITPRETDPPSFAPPGAPSLTREEHEEENEEVEDFQEHFESSRMSVFASETPEQLLSSKDAADFAHYATSSRVNSSKERDIVPEESEGQDDVTIHSAHPFLTVPEDKGAEKKGKTEKCLQIIVKKEVENVAEKEDSPVSVPPFSSGVVLQHDVGTAPASPQLPPPPPPINQRDHHDHRHHLGSSPPGSPPTTRYAKRARVDFSYPLEWIREHVSAMEQLAMELGSLVPLMKAAHKENKSFRASALKKQAEWQALPVNLHYQLMSVRPYSTNLEVSRSLRTEVIHSVTCGAMTPHMLGHKKGGLYYQESKLVTSKGELDRQKAQFVEKLHMAGNTRISTSPSEPFGVHKRLQDLGAKALQFESVCLQICHRRAYAISQSLSIAVNSLLLKIGLVIQGSIPERVAEQWLTCGILLVFEGLLSVVAHERSMLEDTISAVDALRSFQVRLLPYPDEAHHYFNNGGDGGAGSNADQQVPASAAADLNLDDLHLNVSVDAATTAAFNTHVGTHNHHDSAEISGQTNSVNALPSVPPRTLKLELRGREVLVYVPRASLSRLPPSYQSAAYSRGGAVIPLYSVLFTQGIDIQQTMVTTFGGDSAQGRTNNLHLQHDVNLKGLRDVNAYCMKALPVSTDYLAHHAISSSGGSGSNVRSVSTNHTPPVMQYNHAKITHPMVKTLHDTILSSSLTLKNVDLLIEVERLSVMLGGVRVTFCKSGKDRTGMACTLDQSRQLGERYGCGMSVPRTLKDANLMRVHGCRLLIAEKNIGRKVYSINRMQAQFLPVMFRPPNSVCEDLLKKDNS